MEEESDRDLVRRMQARDQAAFDEFFTDYFARLFRFALSRLRDEDAAEEVVQSTLILAIRKLGTWRGEAPLFTWLCTICRREMSVLAARTSRRVFLPLVDDDPDVRAALESLGGAADGPDAPVAREEVGRRVQMTLDYLPPRYSRALEWKYLEELSVQEMAARLHITPKAVESLLTRAREAFRDAFAALQTRARES
jgi:RNA polymerase sigma-70 factor (ECF subfamily)